jgi:hypothetical protein
MTLVEEGVRRAAGPRRPHVGTVAAAAVLAAVTALGCGDSSDKPSDQASAAASAAKPKPKAKPTPTSGPDAWRAQGTQRLAALRLGTPGTLIVQPHGLTGTNGDRWYDAGTKVTIKVRNTKTARFVGWDGACAGKKTTTCHVQMNDFVRVLAGFELDTKAAKGLPKSDPALQPGSRGPGVGPES